MTEEKIILVCGVGEEASAVARRLFGDGHAVVLHRATAPQFLRRGMCFADAWYDGYAYLDGIEARRADVSSEFLVGLRTRQFIPLLRGSFSDVVCRWPWDVIVVAQEEKEPMPSSLRDLADVSIGLGTQFRPGVDCDLAIETDGFDPGAILRQGDPPSRRGAVKKQKRSDEIIVRAPATGQFRTRLSIGHFVQSGELVGAVDDVQISAPQAGRIRGFARQRLAVVIGTPLVEIAVSPTTRCVGISDRMQLISRGASFAVEMESEGSDPALVGNWW